MRKDNSVFGDVFGFKDNIQALAIVGKSAQAVQLELVSGNLYEQMEVRPALGRAIFASDDNAPGADAVATISDGFWERAFGRAPNALGP